MSNEERIKGTFLHGDLKAVSIMIHSSGESACMNSGSGGGMGFCNQDEVLCQTKLVDKESI
jgi:hypothetical protein